MIVRVVFLKNVNDFVGRFSVYLGDIYFYNGYVISFGNFSFVWKVQRKIVYGVLKFYSVGIEKLEMVIIREIEEVFQQFDFSKGEFYDLYYSISLGVINVICLLIFGF